MKFRDVTKNLIKELKANPPDPDVIADIIGHIVILMDGIMEFVPNKKVKLLWPIARKIIGLIRVFIANLDDDD